MEVFLTMLNIKRFACTGLAAILVVSLPACGKDKSSGYTPLPEEDDTVYNISLCQDEDSDYYNNISQGFNDALTDLFGSAHVNVTTMVANNTIGTDSICADYVTGGTDLIFANGKKSLSSAATATEDIPIVGAAVMDYQSVLHLATASDSSWNKKTGTNVTGISSKPNLEEQLSLLIEATPDLQSVGLLYNPEDTDGIYQNVLLEKYLDQAGIPWKEYALPSDDIDSSISDELTDATAIAPTKQIASSVTEGSNNDVVSFAGNDLLSGIFSPSSAHVASTSATWTPDLSIANAEPLAADASLEDIVQYACNECSVLFLPAESQLTSEVQTIVDIATASGTRTVGGDASLGQETLVSMYKDPYAMGYAAGKMVYRILVDGADPGDIKITNSPAENVKLYNASRAESLGMTFPKSFHEINDYFANYEIGSTTTRISSDDTAE